MSKKSKPQQVLRQDIPVFAADPLEGLSAQQATDRKKAGWANGMPESATLTEKEIVLRNTLTFFNLVLLVLAVILVLVGSSVKNMAFMIVVFSNAAIGCYQEIRAKRAVDKLTLVAAQKLRAVREGQIVRLRSDWLVRDDIVEFVAGDQICADGIVRSGELYVNESLVTGEADAILKRPGDELKSGSFVVAGIGRAQLTRVGGDSFAARLAAEAKANPQAAKSEMMRALDRLIRVVSIALIPIGIILFCQSYLALDQGLQQSAEGMVAALVGMIPQGLYLLTSVAMAASALKLARDKVLVQDMNCIETLARVDVLCVDKTGTITEAKMEVAELISLADEPVEQILSAIYSTQEPENDTAGAMTEKFAAGTEWECTNRIPFTSETKWSAATFREQGTFVIGAPEFVMGQRYGELRGQVEDLSTKGYRVLLLCRHNGEVNKVLNEHLLTPLALVALTNRIRPEAPDTFAYFARQGVTIKVISGDNPVTVSEVARRAGISNAEAWVDANLLENDEDFLAAVEQYTVFGRVTPDKKKRLIWALKQQKHTVAMTGDGVNDVLAMKEADCGIAMASGAQAASQIAQLVLLNSDFSAMPGIVGEGRRVINNIQRAAALFLVKNIFSMGLAFITFFTGWPYPMEPFHLTIISALTIGVPSFFLAMEPNYERVGGSFIRGVLRKALPGGLTNILMVLAAQACMSAFSLPQEQISTVCAAILGLVGLLVLFQTCRPFGAFRRIVWGAMAVALVACFTLLRGFFELQVTLPAVLQVMAVLLFVTPVVFLVIQWLCNLVQWLIQRRSRKTV